MLYEIINPSDPYVFETNDEAAAICACVLLGTGKYGLRREDGSTACPILIFGDAVEELGKLLGMSLEQALAEKQEAICGALSTVTIGDFADYRTVQKHLAALPQEEREPWLATRRERKRTSLNDIGERALNLVRAMAA